MLGDAVKWAQAEGADTLFVETAGLCLRCAPYIVGAFGLVVLEATSGMNLPRKIGAMLSLADLAVVTKIDLVSQAEKEVFRANIAEAAAVPVIEADATSGRWLLTFAALPCRCSTLPSAGPLAGSHQPCRRAPSAVSMNTSSCRSPYCSGRAYVAESG
ncbi:MAG: hypothetical protein M5U30_00285 [Burkholderiaceae bacterium]|nr:hypothetical protein [Burkholderiaceae bacterium]